MNKGEVQHLLETPWTLFVASTTFTKSAAVNVSEWESQIKKLHTFDTIEMFWRLWNNIPPGTELSFGSDYFLFREGIRPSWEEPQNEGGGRFLIRFSREDPLEIRKAEKYWIWCVLSLIGETISHSEYINGVNFSLRRQGIKIAIWIKKCPSDEMLRSIGLDIRHMLSSSSESKLPYEAHGKSETLFTV